MSVRIDASGDSLSRTTNLPTITGFTIMGWFYLVSDRGSATYQSVFALGDATGAEYYVVYWEGGTNSRWALWNGATEYTHGSLGPSTGTWYHIAATVAGTGASQFNAYIHSIAGAQVATLTGSGYTGPSAGKLWIGNDNDSEFSNERAAAIKIYDAVLTQAEIQQEMFSILPQRTANINSWYPCFPGATERLADYSTNGYNWTAGGTLTDEDPPPISWGGKSILFPYAAAGGTTYNQSADGAMTLSGAVAKLTNKALAGGVTPSGTVSKQISKIVSGAISSIAGTLATIRLFFLSLSGGITPSGTIAKQTNKTADGSITPSGTVTKSTAKVVSGALSSIVGSISRLTSKAFSGDITPSGIITSVRTFLVSISGGITPSGTVAKSTSKAFTGSVTPDGTISRAIAKTAAGGITPAGSIVKQIAKSISGIISSIVGALTTVFTSNSVEGEAAVSDSTIYTAGATDSATRSASASDSTRFTATINDVEST